jgi:hypothetical protein
MTETSVLPISGETVPPSSYDGEPSDDGGEGANRRKLLIVGAVAGVAVLAAAAFLLLHGGSSNAPVVTGAVPHGTVQASPPATTHTSGKTTTLPKKAKAQAGRNPFAPLFLAPSDSGTAVGGTTTVSTPPTPVSSTPTNPVTPPPPVTTPPTSGLGSPTFIQLLSTNGAKSATFKVGYSRNRFKKYVVLAPKGSSTTGTVFDTEFSLLGVQDSQATLQIGDGTPFDLSKGVVRRL